MLINYEDTKPQTKHTKKKTTENKFYFLQLLNKILNLELK